MDWKRNYHTHTDFCDGQNTPEEMVGKKVMVLVNLKPATLAGVVSEGMILCAEDADGNLSIMTPEKEMPAGAEIC